MNHWEAEKHRHGPYCTCVECVNARLAHSGKSHRPAAVTGAIGRRHRSSGTTWRKLFLVVFLLASVCSIAYLEFRHEGDTGVPHEVILKSDPAAAPTSSPSIGDLKQYALQLINEDRAQHGLPAVEMGANSAAQSHADDMLANKYIGHWWTDGEKPYMVYTETGGDSYARENVATASDGSWAEECEAGLRFCQKIDPYAEIRDLEYIMMYDDADSNWGHRDNILGVEHQHVNIGIAYSNYFLSFVEHFEGGAVTAMERPSISRGILELKARINEPSLQIHRAISIYYDPAPMPKTPSQIDTLHSYCIGGGFTMECPGGDFYIYPPAQAGYHYDLERNEIEADEWTISDGLLTVRADVSTVAREPGVYTIVVFGDADSGAGSGLLLALSIELKDH